MRFLYAIFFIIIASSVPADAGLLISEAVTAAKEDWVELRLYPGDEDARDISRLYVTMYYGSNEPLASEAVTLRTCDDDLTSWDDRYAVVHLTSPGIPDETDRAGDVNRNGIRDIYCDNYTASLWNSDCIVAIDTDDDPANGGIIDCLIYSSRDGAPAANLLPYMKNAVKNNAWINMSDDIQLSALDIGKNGLTPYMSIVRMSSNDTNSAADFAITCLSTPGRENRLLSGKVQKGFVRAREKTVSRTVYSASDCLVEIVLMVQSLCDISYQIYASNGLEVFSSPGSNTFSPGPASFFWRPLREGKVLPTGLYFCRLRARDRSSGRQEECIIRVVLHKRRR